MLTIVSSDNKQQVTLDITTGKFSGVVAATNRTSKKQADYIKEYTTDLLIPTTYAFDVKPNQNPSPTAGATEFPEE